MEFFLPQEIDGCKCLVEFVQLAIDLEGQMPLKPFLVSPGELCCARRSQCRCALKRLLELHVDLTHQTYPTLCVRLYLIF